MENKKHEMPTRKQAVEFAYDQFEEGNSGPGQEYRYGKCDIQNLLDYIYGDQTNIELEKNSIWTDKDSGLSSLIIKVYFDLKKKTTFVSFKFFSFSNNRHSFSSEPEERTLSIDEFIKNFELDHKQANS